MRGDNEPWFLSRLAVVANSDVSAGSKDNDVEPSGAASAKDCESCEDGDVVCGDERYRGDEGLTLTA